MIKVVALNQLLFVTPNSDATDSMATYILPIGESYCALNAICCDAP
jgi:hypothetical protein